MKEYIIKFSNGTSIRGLLGKDKVKLTQQFIDDKTVDKNGVSIVEMFPADFKIKPSDFFKNTQAC